MRKLLFALATIAIASIPTAAADLSFEDMLGRWCQGDGASIVFTHNQLNVVLANGATRTLKISKAQVKDNSIVVTWDPPIRPDGASNATEYELSVDKRLLVQRPNRDDTGKAIGDKGPRRELRRC
jgi:hypothetical protein